MLRGSSKEITIFLSSLLNVRAVQSESGESKPLIFLQSIQNMMLREVFFVSLVYLSASPRILNIVQSPP